MADQKTTDAAISDAVKTYYDQLLIERLEPKTRLFQWGKKRPIPRNGGKTIEFTGYRNLKPILSNSNELSSTQIRLSAYKISKVLIQRHQYAQFSELFKMTQIDPNLEEATDVMADLLAKTVEKYIQQEVVGKIGTVTRSSIANNGINTTAASHDTNGTVTGNSAQRTHYFWSDYPTLFNKARVVTSANRNISTAAGSALSLNQVKHGVTFLLGQNVNTFEDGQFVIYVHPQGADALMSDPKWGTWNSPQNAQKMWRGEVGSIFGARVVTGTMAFRYVYSAAPLSTASGAYNVGFLLGKDAYGVSEISRANAAGQGFEIIVKNSGAQTTSDPASLISTIAGKMTMAATVLNKSAAACIKYTDKVVSSVS